jgi:beta-lactamase class A
LSGKLASVLALFSLIAMPVPALPADAGHDTVAVSSLDAALMRQLSSIVAQGRGRVGIGVYEIGGSRQLAINGDHAFPMASTMKIAVAATFLQGVDEGRFRLYDSYPLRFGTTGRNADGSVPTRAGTMLTAQSLIELMITKSSNPATDALLEAVGGPPAVNAWLRKAGITGQRIDRNIATLLRDDLAKNDPSLGIDKRDSSTPVAMVQLLAALHNGNVLSPASRAVLLGAMSRCRTGRNRIPAGLPMGTLVAHKTGTLWSQTSDVGIIRMPDGRDVALSIFVTGPESHAVHARQIADITRAVYDSFTVQFARSGRPVPGTANALGGTAVNPLVDASYVERAGQAGAGGTD